MELTAVLEALREINGDVQVVSDSQYVVKCFTQQWWAKWLKSGWRTASGKPVANRDIWEPLIALYRASPRKITFRWVRGHAGNKWNEAADLLATTAARSQQGRHGTLPRR